MNGSTGRGTRGGLVTVAGQLLKILVQLASVAILSRLLVPEDFGLIAMTAVLVSLGVLIRDFGLPTAALQAKQLSPQQASNLFWANTSLGGLAAVALYITSPLVVSFYQEPRVGPILSAISVTLLLGGMSAQLQVQLARNFKFIFLAVAEVTSQLLGLSAAITCAIFGFGYWALVWQIIVTATALLLLQALFARWKPLRPRRGFQTRQVASSGAHFGAAQVLTFASSNADSVILGARWGAEELGYYNRAFQILALPIQAMMAPLTNVVVPVANKAREAGQSIDSVLLRVQFLTGGATVWVFLVAGISAPYFLPLLLGAGWDRTVGLFQILAIGGAAQTFSFVSYWGFILYEQSRELLRYNLFTKILTIVALLVSSFWSIEAVAWAYSVSLLLSWPVNLIWLRRTAKQDSWAYFRNGLRILSAAGTAAILTNLAMNFVEPELPSALGVLTTVSASSLLYLVLLACLPGGTRELLAAVSILRSIRK